MLPPFANTRIQSRTGHSTKALVFAAVLLSSLALSTACRAPSLAERVRRGDVYVEKKRLAEAIIEYRAALQLDPRAGAVHVKLAEACMSVNDVRCALSAYVRAADLVPTDIEAQLNAGKLLLLTRQF